MSTHDLLLAANDTGSHTAAHADGYADATREPMLGTQEILRSAWHSYAMRKLGANETCKPDDDLLVMRQTMHKLHYLTGALDARLDRAEPAPRTRVGMGARGRAGAHPSVRTATIEVIIDHVERRTCVVQLRRETMDGYAPSYSIRRAYGEGRFALAWTEASGPADVLRFADHHVIGMATHVEPMYPEASLAPS